MVNNDCDDDNDTGHYPFKFLEMEPSDSIESDIRINASSTNATSRTHATTKVIHSTAKLARIEEEEDDGEFDEAGAKLIACAAGSMTCAALLPLFMFL
jgi:hypothetical protein